MFTYYIYKSIYKKVYSYFSKHISIFLCAWRGSVFIYNINQLSVYITHFSYYICIVLYFYLHFFICRKGQLSHKNWSYFLKELESKVNRREMGKEETNVRFSCNCRPRNTRKYISILFYRFDLVFFFPSQSST